MSRKKPRVSSVVSLYPSICASCAKTTDREGGRTPALPALRSVYIIGLEGTSVHPGMGLLGSESIISLILTFSPYREQHQEESCTADVSCLWCLRGGKHNVA